MTAVRLLACGALLTVAGLLAAPWTAGTTRRLRRLSPAPSRHRRSWSTGREPLRVAAPVAAGLAVVVIVGGLPGALAGIPVAIGVHLAVRRLPSRAARAERAQAAADLPIVADLVAAVLRAGAPVDQAALAVGAAIGGPLGVRLAQAGRALRLGAAPEQAWSYLGDLADADRLVRAAVRGNASGAALAGGLTRLADEVRAGRAIAADAAARRAGVLVVLPLGLCFLPAFVLAGLVPVIVAVLGDVW